jgi:hypothetical protein
MSLTIPKYRKIKKPATNMSPGLFGRIFCKINMISYDALDRADVGMEFDVKRIIGTSNHHLEETNVHGSRAHCAGYRKAASLGRQNGVAGCRGNLQF